MRSAIAKSMIGISKNGIFFAIFYFASDFTRICPVTLKFSYNFKKVFNLLNGELCLSFSWSPKRSAIVKLRSFLKWRSGSRSQSQFWRSGSCFEQYPNWLILPSTYWCCWMKLKIHILFTIKAILLFLNFSCRSQCSRFDFMIFASKLMPTRLL